MQVYTKDRKRKNKSKTFTLMSEKDLGEDLGELLTHFRNYIITILITVRYNVYIVE